MQVSWETETPGLGLGCSNEENMGPALGSSQLRGEMDSCAALIPRAPSWTEWGCARMGTGSCMPSMTRTNLERCLDFKNCSALRLRWDGTGMQLAGHRRT